MAGKPLNELKSSEPRYINFTGYKLIPAESERIKYGAVPRGFQNLGWKEPLRRQLYKIERRSNGNRN